MKRLFVFLQGSEEVPVRPRKRCYIQKAKSFENRNHKINSNSHAHYTYPNNEQHSVLPLPEKLTLRAHDHKNPPLSCFSTKLRKAKLNNLTGAQPPNQRLWILKRFNNSKQSKNIKSFVNGRSRRRRRRMQTRFQVK